MTKLTKKKYMPKLKKSIPKLKKAVKKAELQIIKSNMSFGDATLVATVAAEANIETLAIQRVGWNGKGMYLKLQVPDTHSKMTHPYFYFTIPNCEEGTRLIPYTPTIVDTIAKDWVVIKLT